MWRIWIVLWPLNVMVKYIFFYKNKVCNIYIFFNEGIYKDKLFSAIRFRNVMFPSNLTNAKLIFRIYAHLGISIHHSFCNFPKFT